MRQVTDSYKDKEHVRWLKTYGHVLLLDSILLKRSSFSETIYSLVF